MIRCVQMACLLYKEIMPETIQNLGFKRLPLFIKHFIPFTITNILCNKIFVHFSYIKNTPGGKYSRVYMPMSLNCEKSNFT